MDQTILINQDENQEILINSNEPQLIQINNVNTQDLEISQNNNQDLSINQADNQVILIDGGGAVIGITDVLVNGVTVVSGNIAYVIVPTKTSELENDSHFITSETDPTVPSYVKQISLADINNWNSKQNELVSGSTIKTINNESLLGSGNINIESGNTYTAGYGIDITNNVISNELTSYNDLTDLPTIPDKTSDLLNDSDYVSESELSEVAFTGSYTSLSDTPQYLSDFINDGEDGIHPFLSDCSTMDIKGLDYYSGDYGITVTDNLTFIPIQEKLVSGTNIKTINSNSILGNGDLVIGGGSATDVQINGTSITSSNVANIITESAYNSSTNKIATMSDVPTIPSNLAYTNIDNNFSNEQTINGTLNITKNGKTTGIGTSNIYYCNYNTDANNGHYFNKNVYSNGQFIATDSIITTGNDTGVICDNTQATNPRKTKYTVSNSGNAGIYDMTNSSWIIRSETSQNVYIPHPLYVSGDIYGGSSANKRIAYADEIPTIATSVTLNNEWIMGYKASGDNFAVMIPFNNPNNSTVTVNITTAEVYAGGWQSLTYGGVTVLSTFVKLGFSTTASLTNGSVYLVRITGTISI